MIEVYERALSTFLLLLFRLRANLKLQIEVFIKEILLNILDIPTRSLCVCVCVCVCVCMCVCLCVCVCVCVCVMHLLCEGFKLID